MQQEDRRIGRDRVQLVDRRQALLGELVLGEAADDAHPLRRRA
jgi:hypothetical protein